MYSTSKTIDPSETPQDDGTSIPTPHTAGTEAGTVWRYLRQHGETSIVKLKSEIQSPASAVFLSLGWLMREDKVKFSHKKGHLHVQLKEEEMKTL